MQRRDEIVVKKVISEIEIGLEMLGDTDIEAFLNDEKLKRALGMTVINIGELIKNVTEETRKEHSNISWKAVAGMRDITAHKYQTLRMEDVYTTVKEDFVTLKEQLTLIM